MSEPLGGRTRVRRQLEASDPETASIDNCGGRVRSSQVEVKPERVIDSGYDGSGKMPQSRAEPIDRHRSDLFRLRLRLNPRSGKVLGKENLEGEYPPGVAGDGNDRHHPTAESIRHRIGAVVAHDDRRATLVRLAPSNRVEIDKPDFASSYHDSPSPTVFSHAARSPANSHSVQASA